MASEFTHNNSTQFAAARLGAANSAAPLVRDVGENN